MKNDIIVRKGSPALGVLQDSGFTLLADFATDLWLGWYCVDPDEWISLAENCVPYRTNPRVLAVVHADPIGSMTASAK